MTKLVAKATVSRDSSRITVDITWSGAKLDRPCTGGFGLRANDQELAARLCAAINAQAVEVDPVVMRDVNGKTYVSSTSRVMGRRMNADLKRLGF